MIAIVVPAHNEAKLIRRCIASLKTAASAPSLCNEQVMIYVVADDCTDKTVDIATRCDVHVLVCQARNVGLARALGANAALAHGARWIAFTDADSEVSQDWLYQQLLQRSDAVCGTVQVKNWRNWGPLHGVMHDHFKSTYRDEDGHRHIHGANLGVSAAAYLQAGGFPALASHEDVALVRALQALGANIAWSSAPRVTTSARKSFRAQEGFGATLARVASEYSRPAMASE